MPYERDSNRVGEKNRCAEGGRNMSGYSSIVNGKKGGRPKSDSSLKIEIPDINLVILTPKQYGSLTERYGYELLSRAVRILENWLQTSPEAEKYIGKNNYAHFRSDGWVINTARYKV